MKTVCRKKRGGDQYAFLSVVLALAFVILFSHAVSLAGEVRESGRSYAAKPLSTTVSPGVSGQQPASRSDSGLLVRLAQRGHEEAPVPGKRPTPPEPQPVRSSSQQTPASQTPSSSQQAIDVLRAEMAVDSLNPQVHYQLANALHDAGNMEEAFIHYDKAVWLKPDFKEALVNRGALLNEMGRVQDAISSFRQALALAPRDTRALVNLGNSYYALQLYDDALKQYRAAIEADSTFAEGYYYIGVAFADAGIYREAVRDWEMILAVAPSSEAARNARENIDLLRNFLSGTESETQTGTE